MVKLTGCVYSFRKRFLDKPDLYQWDLTIKTIGMAVAVAVAAYSRLMGLCAAWLIVVCTCVLW